MLPYVAKGFANMIKVKDLEMSLSCITHVGSI